MSDVIYAHLAGRARGLRFLHDARHRGAGPVRAGARPVLGLALAAWGEDRRPERVFVEEGGEGLRCAAWDGQLVGRGEVRGERGRRWRGGEEDGGVRCGGGLAHALEVREGRRVEAGGFVPSDNKGEVVGSANEGRKKDWFFTSVRR